MRIMNGKYVFGQLFRCNALEQLLCIFVFLLRIFAVVRMEPTMLCVNIMLRIAREVQVIRKLHCCVFTTFGYRVIAQMYLLFCLW